MGMNVFLLMVLLIIGLLPEVSLATRAFPEEIKKMVVETKSQVLIHTGKLSIIVDKSPYRLRVEDCQRKILMESTDGPESVPIYYVIGKDDAKQLFGYRQDAEIEVTRHSVQKVIDFYEGDSSCIFICSTNDRLRSRFVEIRITLLDESTFEFRAQVKGVQRPCKDVFKFGTSYCSPQEERYFGMGKPNERSQHRGYALSTWINEGALGVGKYRELVERLAPMWRNLKKAPYLDDMVDPMLSENPTLLAPGTASHWTYPFFISNRGYGYLLKMSEPAWFDFASKKHNVLNIEALSDLIDFVFFYGPEPMKIVQAQARFSGLQPLAPLWAFAPWMSRDVYNNMAEVYEDKDKMREYDIPCSIIVIDSPWDVHYHDYEFNPVQFPHPKEMIDNLHAAGYKVILWHTSFMNSNAKYFKEGMEKGFYVKTPLGTLYPVWWWKSLPLSTDPMSADALYGAIVDLSNPDAVAWWQSLVQKALDYGIDGFKDDGGEYVPQNSELMEGSGLKMHNVYPDFYNSAVFKLCSENRKEFVVDPRAGYSGTQRWCNVMWAGDQSSDWDKGDGFPTVIVGGVALGMCGVPFYGHDIGGYTDYTSGPLTLELFIRWAQFGSLSPIMQIHSMRNIKPWSFGDDGVRLYRKFAKLHTQLVPYTYTFAKLANSTGVPIIRHPFLVHPEDPAALNDSFSYYYGDSLFVAPFYEPGGRRAIYFPKGSMYIDWFTGERHAGGTTVEYACELDRMPLFVLEGSIIPLFHPEVDTLAPVSSGIEGDSETVTAGLGSDLMLRIYPGKGESRFSLYDGSVITARANGKDLSLWVTSETKRNIEFEVFGEYRLVKLNDKAVDVAISDGKTYFSFGFSSF